MGKEGPGVHVDASVMPVAAPTPDEPTVAEKVKKKSLGIWRSMFSGLRANFGSPFLKYKIEKGVDRCLT